MAIVTHEQYLKFCKTIDVDGKKVCDFCGKSLLKNSKETQWKFYKKDRFEKVLIFWHTLASNFIFHPECAMNLSIELIKDSKNSKFGKNGLSWNNINHGEKNESKN